jgi:hypothetical protein
LKTMRLDRVLPQVDKICLDLANFVLVGCILNINIVT